MSPHENELALVQDALARRKGVRLALLWCLPALCGFALFLFSFPIDRQMPFWPHLSIAELFTLWFLFITPITTTVAVVVFVKRNKSAQLSKAARSFVWAAIIMSVLVNAFVLVGM